MTGPTIGDGTFIALINAISLVAVAYLQYKTKKEVKEVRENTREQTSTINETKSVVDTVHQIANGRLTEALQQVEALKQENDRLRAETLHRRSTDA